MKQAAPVDNMLYFTLLIIVCFLVNMYLLTL